MIDARTYLNKIVSVKIDRPIGSRHPKYDYIYPVNYGYVPNTVSGDGEELDCYVLGVFEPLKEFDGKCIALIHRVNDNDDKLIIVPENREMDNKEIEALIEFQERFFKHQLIRKDIVFNSLIPELSVSNIEKSKKFYENLGFKIIYERIENKFCFMQIEDNQIMIEEKNDNWSVGKLEYPYGNGINISMTICFQAVMAKASLKVRGILDSTTMRLPNVGPGEAEIKRAEDGMRASGLL